MGIVLHRKGSSMSASQTARPATGSKAYVPPVLKKGPRLGAVTGLGMMSPVPCWVARAAFGTEDLRWMVFRAWLMEDAPAWFRRLYLRHGEAFGAWLAGRDRMRALVRAAMKPAIRSRLRR
jgi:hypothetical protein